MKKRLSVIRKRLTVKNILFSLSVLFIFSLTFNFSLLTFSSAASVDETVAMLQERYGRIRDIKGVFVQTSHLKDLEKVEKYKGEFFVKKPSSMKWRYFSPRDEEVVIRDTDTWIYKKSEKQVLKTTFSRDTLRQVPIALLNSLGDLKTDFDITMLKEGVLELRPKRAMGYIKGILLQAVPLDFPVKKFSVLDTYENHIIVEIKDVTVNSGLEDSLFIFETPPGVEVIDMNR